MSVSQKFLRSTVVLMVIMEETQAQVPMKGLQSTSQACVNSRSSSQVTCNIYVHRFSNSPAIRFPAQSLTVTEVDR
ncbi:hypothetical protein BOTBODRAFT_245781 [Botryobasidium botryosum FD-172 SS1]|uniref:Uncharacterized protein n=1 Tax=Botryobasidium botryosum (strain FD-172 SS1) TaxID=930990 RepID=A0A067LW96_BOTB1|nr:hypothetical protein BOTBODRAFT_245781 [Botryobasidium botryosum FD-172 SS1]